MYRLDLGLGWSVFRLSFVPREPNSSIWDKIEQHRFLVNEDILQYYHECAENEGIPELYEDKIKELLSYDGYVEIKEDNNGIANALARHFKHQNKSDSGALIYEDGEPFKCSKNACRFQYDLLSAQQDERSILMLYSTPLDFQTEKGENISMYLSWFYHMIANEPEINIIDQYAFSTEGSRYFLNNVVVPYMDRGGVLNIHCQEITDMNHYSELKKNAAAKNIDLHVYEYIDMHDRYITTAQLKITVGLGFDLFNSNKRTMRKGTNIHVVKKAVKKSDGYLDYEKRLAGTYQREYQQT